MNGIDLEKVKNLQTVSSDLNGKLIQLKHVNTDHLPILNEQTMQFSSKNARFKTQQ